MIRPLCVPVRVFAALSLTLATTPLLAQPCEPRWSDQFAHDDVTGDLAAITVLDPDGAGPRPAELFIAGAADGSYSVHAGGRELGGVGRWDGEQWRPLAPLDGKVNALCVFDDGSGPALYAAGAFTQAGGPDVRRVARWDGSAWHPLGAGLSGMGAEAHALAVWDEDGPGPAAPALYVGGVFSSAGSVPASNIARWNGSSWSTLGAGITGGAVHAIHGSTIAGQPALYAGGEFSAAGGASAVRLARWDGQAWSSIGGVSGQWSPMVSAICTYDHGTGPRLHIAGKFDRVGDIAANAIAAWNGAAWSSLRGGLTAIDGPPVKALLVHDDDGAGPLPPRLYAGGAFFEVDGVRASGLARWDGASWTHWGDDLQRRGVIGLARFPTGDTTGLVAIRSYLYGSSLLQWDGLTWAPFERNVPARIHAVLPLEQGGQPALYVGGSFTSILGQPTRSLARWNGSVWSEVGGGVDGGVRALAAYTPDAGAPDLYVAGDVTAFGGQPIRGIARWNGQNWAQLGAGILAGSIRTLAVFDDDGAGPVRPALYAGGYFSLTPGLYTCLARWDGAAWTEIPFEMPSSSRFLLALEVFNGHTFGETRESLYVGGSMSPPVAGVTPYLARWDGQQWHTVAPTLNGAVHAMEVFDADGAGPVSASLCVAGAFTSDGAKPLPRIAMLSGGEWSPLPGPVTGEFRTLASFDDGRGLALFAGGRIGDPADPTTRGLARFDGQTWSIVGGGLTFDAFEPAVDVLAPAVVNDRPILYAAGAFSAAGGTSAGRIGAWLGCPPCPADCDGNGFLALPDFLCFRTLFVTGNMRADFDGSGTLTLNDFVQFRNAYVAGCP